MERVRAHRLLLIILSLYLLLGVGYTIAVPLAETPDESEHFRYLQAILNDRALPLMSPVRAENVTLEAHQPPLYYLTGAALTGWLGTAGEDPLVDNPCFSFEPEDPGRQHAFLHQAEEWPPQTTPYLRFYLMRWFSLLLGAATIILAYVLAGQVFPGTPYLAPGTAALLAFNPQFVFITASFNNDVPTALLGTAVTVLAIRAARRPRPLGFALLGGALGAGLLTKFALLAFWPLALLAALLPLAPAGWRARWPLLAEAGRYRQRRNLWLNLALIVGLPLLVAGWWYGRNYRLYGDPLMWEITLAAKGSVVGRSGALAWADLVDFATFHFQSYWLWFGWLNIKAPGWVYAGVGVMVGLAIAGLLRFLHRRQIRVAWLALALAALAVLAIYASLLRYIQTINWTGYQGRLAFAAAASIALFLALGLAALGGRRLVAAAGAALFLLSAAALPLLLLPAYPRPAIYQPAGPAARTCARFDGGLQVEALVAADDVRAGQTLPVTVYGYGLAPAASPQQIVVRLTGADGALLGEDRARLRWSAGEVVSTTVQIPVAADAGPVRGTLAVAMEGPDGRRQAATSATTRPLVLPLPVADVRVAAATPVRAAPDTAVEGEFGERLALLGYDLETAPGSATFTLYWQATAEMDVAYTTFVHLLDDAGQLVAQADGQPHGGAYPTDIWVPGEVVADGKTITLPPEAPAGPYRVVAGVYRLDSGARLPLAGHEGDTLLLLEALRLP